MTFHLSVSLSLISDISSFRGLLASVRTDGHNLLVQHYVFILLIINLIIIIITLNPPEPYPVTLKMETKTSSETYDPRIPSFTSGARIGKSKHDVMVTAGAKTVECIATGVN